MNYTIDQIKAVFASKGYTYFEGDKPYNLNIVGIRKTRDSVVNTFEDLICVLYNDEGNSMVLKSFPATTKPGTYFLKHPINVSGTAIMSPGQYIEAYSIGLHRDQYRALVQVRPIKVFRDSNQDDVIDLKPEKIIVGVYGLNIHESNPFTPSYRVDKWSAGCQVFQSPVDFARFMKLCDRAVKQYGNRFTYTLLTEDDFAV